MKGLSQPVALFSPLPHTPSAPGAGSPSSSAVYPSVTLDTVQYQPEFTDSAQVVVELEAIAVLRERILAATVQVPWMPSLQRDARVRNTHRSTCPSDTPAPPLCRRRLTCAVPR